MLRRRAKEVDDPNRYVIASPFTQTFCLFYTCSDGMFIMNEIGETCLFKRKAEALAVAKLVHGRLKRPAQSPLQVIAVQKTPKGIRIIGKVRDPSNPIQRWTPVLLRCGASSSKGTR